MGPLAMNQNHIKGFIRRNFNGPVSVVPLTGCHRRETCATVVFEIK